MLKNVAASLRKDDVVSMTTLACNLKWLETFNVSLSYHENTVWRVQQTHFSIAYTLAELMDQRLQARSNNEV